jgi:hypothetical protein
MLCPEPGDVVAQANVQCLGDVAAKGKTVRRVANMATNDLYTLLWLAIRNAACREIVESVD